MKKYFFLFSIIIFCSAHISGQSIKLSGWLYITHSQKLSDKIDVIADAQLRSAGSFDYLNTLLLRTGLKYNFNKVHSLALGYTYVGSWEREISAKVYSFENRIFEQYLADFDIAKTEMNIRLRLEQRFIEENSQIDFSQRARVMVSAKIPLLADSSFSKGFYTFLQEEVFFNVQHKTRVNNALFDQNRSLIAIGYRWNKKIDTDLGYMFWYQKEDDKNIRNNVFQLTVTTSL